MTFASTSKKFDASAYIERYGTTEDVDAFKTFGKIEKIRTSNRG